MKREKEGGRKRGEKGEDAMREERKGEESEREKRRGKIRKEGGCKRASKREREFVCVQGGKGIYSVHRSRKM